ncbi:c-type cytochrome [Pseudothauera hydrothermalis]|uniref:c-type cytochrome n=1 Tax=Pseudothauera hydrothermalis TaxID=2184083 RepID=UPI0013C2E9A0|nr:c-type cytochrome [Pseudothauera hydrothermalis]
MSTPTRACADTTQRRRSRALLLALLLVIPGGVGAATPVAPTVDLSGLPALGNEWREENPYRGNAHAIAVGRALYAQVCARCHGAESLEPGPAANLRLVGMYCQRLKDPQLAARCTRDADHYFLTTVLEGKIRLGVEHMPPWAGVLSQEAIWALRSFVEAQRSVKR